MHMDANKRIIAPATQSITRFGGGSPINPVPPTLVRQLGKAQLEVVKCW